MAASGEFPGPVEGLSPALVFIVPAEVDPFLLAVLAEDYGPTAVFFLVDAHLRQRAAQEAGIIADVEIDECTP